MELTIQSPQDISDITLEQFVSYEGVRDEYKDILDSDIKLKEFKEKTINIFTGLDMSLMSSVSHKDKDELFRDCINALNVECEFVSRFKLADVDGVEFGFIPNLDNLLSNGEYINLLDYSVGLDNLHRFMAVMYRPIVKEDSFNNYAIATYKGTTEYADTMKRTPMNIVNGCLGFFLTLRQDLKIHSLKCMEEELVKEL